MSILIIPSSDGFESVSITKVIIFMSNFHYLACFKLKVKSLRP